MKWFLVLPLFLSSVAAATVDADLKKIVSSYRISEDRLGLYVVDLAQPNHPVLLSVNGEKNMIPASLSKLVTTTAILQKFGPSYKFETDILSDASREGDKLKGAIYLRGGGDPSFVSETMWNLVNEFTRTGIKQVGDIVVDESLFDGIRFDDSRDNENSDRAYNAPVGAMSFNWNAINVFVRPGKLKQPPIVILDPEVKGWKVSNHAVTTKEGKADIRVSRVEDGTIVVDGKMPESVPEIVVYKDITNPAAWSGEALRSFLQQRGITVTGSVKEGKTPKTAELLAKIDSKPLSAIVVDMMKFSNNFVAEMLTKGLAAKYEKTPASLNDGVKVIVDTAVSMGIKKENFAFENPSGLSRKNSIRPADLAHLLVENYKRFSYEPEYLVALPLAGVDGTLKKRFLNTDAVGWVRAKTGHLKGAAGLAGYAGQKEGGVRAFVFIFNGPEDQGDLARRLFDALASRLVQ